MAGGRAGSCSGFPCSARFRKLRGPRPTARRLADGRAEVEKWIGGVFEIVEVPIEIVPFDSLDLHPLAVKIDVEGFESDVLQGMEETLARDEPLLMLEHNDAADLLIPWLARRGYDLYTFDAAARRLLPTDDPRGAANYFAITPAWLDRHPRVAAMTGRDDGRVSEAGAAAMS